MIELVRAACREVLRPGDRVVCAVSGGADSMAMLSCMAALAEELGISLSAAHYDHGLRGAESARDAVFVRDYCAAHAIPLAVGCGDVAAGANGQSLEQAARRMRYNFLQQAAGGGWLLTAHTADDNLETLLLNLLRGTGPRGLCGIPPVRGNIFRPLLGATREMVLDWLAATGTPHVEDSTNAGDAALRNRLRHHVTPLLRAETPDLALRTLETCRLLRADEAYLEAQTRALLEQAATDGGWCCGPLRDASLLPRAMRLLLADAGVGSPTARHIRQLCALVSGTDGEATLHLPDGLTARRSYELLTLTRQAAPATFTPVRLAVPGQVRLPGMTLRVRPLAPGEAVPPGALPLPAADEILIRPRRPGDAIRLPGGRKTLKACMIDRKIPAHLRGLMPVLCDGDRILAVVGLGADLDALASGAALLAEQIETEGAAEQWKIV